MRACQVLFCVDVSVEHSVDSAGDQDVEGSVHWGALQGALVMVKGIIGERSCRIMRFVRSRGTWANKKRFVVCSCALDVRWPWNAIALEAQSTIVGWICWPSALPCFSFGCCSHCPGEHTVLWTRGRLSRSVIGIQQRTMSSSGSPLLVRFKVLETCMHLIALALHAGSGRHGQIVDLSLRPMMCRWTLTVKICPQKKVSDPWYCWVCVCFRIPLLLPDHLAAASYFWVAAIISVINMAQKVPHGSQVSVSATFWSPILHLGETQSIILFIFSCDCCDYFFLSYLSILEEHTTLSQGADCLSIYFFLNILNNKFLCNW